MFDGAWGATLGTDAAPIYDRSSQDTEQLVERLYRTIEALGWKFEAPAKDELFLLQRLHDAEFNGSVTWRPGFGFTVEMDDERGLVPSWADAEVWLRAEGNRVLRAWVDNPEA